MTSTALTINGSLTPRSSSALYDQCLPHMVSAFHRQPGAPRPPGVLRGRVRCDASRQRRALVEMLGGDTRAALNVMLYFNVRYGI